jgi:glutaminase
LSIAKVQAVQSLLQRLQGGLPSRINPRAYAAYRQKCNGYGNREMCVSYVLKTTGGMAPEENEVANLDAHFTCHALESTASGLAVVAATLANGGICPTTEERVLSSHTAKSCLSLMHVAGEFEFEFE